MYQLEWATYNTRLNNLIKIFKCVQFRLLLLVMKLWHAVSLMGISMSKTTVVFRSRRAQSVLVAWGESTSVILAPKDCLTVWSLWLEGGSSYSHTMAPGGEGQLASNWFDLAKIWRWDFHLAYFSRVSTINDVELPCTSKQFSAVASFVSLWYKKYNLSRL